MSPSLRMVPHPWCCVYLCGSDAVAVDSGILTQIEVSGVPFSSLIFCRGCICAGDLLPIPQVCALLCQIRDHLGKPAAWIVTCVPPSDRWDRVTSIRVYPVLGRLPWDLEGQSLGIMTKFGKEGSMCQVRQLQRRGGMQRDREAAGNPLDRIPEAGRWHRLQELLGAFVDAAEAVADAANDLHEHIDRWLPRGQEPQRRQNEEHAGERERQRSRSPPWRLPRRADRQGEDAEGEEPEQRDPLGVMVQGEFVWEPPFIVNVGLRARREYRFPYLDRRGLVSDLHQEYARVARRGVWQFQLTQQDRLLQGHMPLQRVNRLQHIVAVPHREEDGAPASAARDGDQDRPQDQPTARASRSSRARRSCCKGA